MAETDVILTADQRVRVVISSALEELAAEQAAAQRAIRRLHLVPVWYESEARPHPPRSMYRAYLKQSQVFVGIYWQRYGWVAPGMEISGLEDEFRLAAGKPMLLYLKRPAPDQEPRMRTFIDDIRAAGTASYRTFATPRELERLLADEAWPAGAALRVRMGLHSGEAHVQDGDYVDHAPINRCARVKAAAHGGQVLVTKTTRDLVAGRLGGGFGLKRLGEFRLRDLAEPELIYQLTHADLPAE